jgi:hypothetical protein
MSEDPERVTPHVRELKREDGALYETVFTVDQVSYPDSRQPSCADVHASGHNGQITIKTWTKSRLQVRDRIVVKVYRAE